MKKTCGILAAVLVAGLAAYAAQNYVSGSGVIAWTNPSAAVTTGQLVDLSDRYGVALVDIASNATGTVMTTGIWKFERATTNALAFGTRMFYSDGDTVTDTYAADKYVGVVTKAVAACLDLTNALGEVDQFVEVELNAGLKPADVSPTAGGDIGW